MDVMTLLAIVGILASVGGAAVSIYQAKQAHSAADEAKKIRLQLIDRRKTSELSRIQEACRKAQKDMGKYGPGSVPSSLEGISTRTDAGSMQEVLAMLQENRSHFGSRKPNAADDFCEALTPLLIDFAHATDVSAIAEYGKQIYLNLGRFLSVIKHSLESKQESIR